MKKNILIAMLCLICILATYLLSAGSIIRINDGDTFYIYAVEKQLDNGIHKKARYNYFIGPDENGSENTFVLSTEYGSEQKYDVGDSVVINVIKRKNK